MTPGIPSHRELRSWILAGLFTALTAVGAFVRIPLPYVPLTLQTVFVLLAGCLLPAKFAFVSQIAYLLIGLAGLPVFANGGGIGYVLQPTFGYLAAFPLAAGLVAVLVQPAQARLGQFRGVVVSNSLGILVVLLLGVLYLFANINWIAGAHLPLRQAFWTGMIIFLPGDLLKVLITSLLAVEIRKRVDV